MAFALLVNIAGFVVPMASTPRAGLGLCPATVPSAPTVSAGLSVRLATVRAAPTVSMVVRRDSEYERVAEMPAQLTQWGCDEEMWTNLRASARKSLRRLATRGDQKGNAREVISNLRAALERDAGASSAPAGGQTEVAQVAQVAQVDPVVKAVKAVRAVKAVAVEKKVEEKVEGEVEEAVEEAVKENSDPAAELEPQAEVEIDVFNSAWPEVEAVGALAPNGFSWGPTF